MTEEPQEARFEDLEQHHMPKGGLPKEMRDRSPLGAVVLTIGEEIVAAFPASTQVHKRAAGLLEAGDLDAHREYLNRFAREGYTEELRDRLRLLYEEELERRAYAREIAAVVPPRQGRRGDN